MQMDSKTLYKLMVLFMLKKVNFPLNTNQISSFFLGKDYTNYFTLQEVLNDMVTNEYVYISVYRNISQYEISPLGDETLSFFENKLPSAIKIDINEYLLQNKFELRNESGTISEYYKSNSQDFIVHCMVKEGSTTAIDLSLAIPSEAVADAMCANWKEKSQEIYEFILKKLME
ncbi:MAG: DUF4364 family protein [Lachnospira sp.]|nr:DUF4364 family protein [Lachnospira sp.]